MAWTYQGNAGQQNRCEDVDALRDAVRVGRLTRATVLYDTTTNATLPAGTHPGLDQWFYQRDGLRQGPFPAATLRRMAATGRLLPDDMVTDLFNQQPRQAFQDFVFPEKTGLFSRLGQAFRNRRHREISLALVGTQGCGKTVFATVLANRLSRTDAATDAEYPITLAPANNNTLHFQGKNWDLLQSEQWPPATQPGKFKRLQWNAELADGRAFRLTLQDMAGHDLRTIFASCAGLNDDGSDIAASQPLAQINLSTEAQKAIDFCSQADIILFLLNLDDFFNLETDRPAPLRSHNEIILAEMFRQLRSQGRRCCLLLTQIDRYPLQSSWTDIGRRAFPFLWQQFIATGDVPFCPLAAVAEIKSTAAKKSSVAVPVPGFHSTGLREFSVWLEKTIADLLSGHATPREDSAAPEPKSKRLRATFAPLSQRLQRWRRNQPRTFRATAFLAAVLLLLAGASLWWRFGIDHEARMLAKIEVNNARIDHAQAKQKDILDQMILNLKEHIRNLERDVATIKAKIAFQHKKDFIGPFDLDIINSSAIDLSGLEFVLYYPQHKKSIQLVADVPAHSTVTLDDVIPRVLLKADFTAEIITCNIMDNAAKARDALAQLEQGRITEAALSFSFIRKGYADLQALDRELKELELTGTRLEGKLARVRAGQIWPWQ
ncbi:MAG TPA: DUF4339 domain-containing protein [Lentisphaeria bacterium]|nr:DUF4339 domain-containing protein [Lentisphaeria bacterium]